MSKNPLRLHICSPNHFKGSKRLCLSSRLVIHYHGAHTTQEVGARSFHTLKLSIFTKLTNVYSFSSLSRWEFPFAMHFSSQDNDRNSGRNKVFETSVQFWTCWCLGFIGRKPGMNGPEFKYQDKCKCRFKSKILSLCCWKSNEMAF